MRFKEISEDIESYDLQAKYDLFNSKYFEGKLPRIPLEFVDLPKGTSAQVIGRTTGVGRGKRLIPDSLRLQVSTKWKRSDEALDGLLLHEMIHVYFMSSGNIKEQHGVYFRAMMRRISRESGIDIPLRDDDDTAELVTPVAAKEYGVLLIQSRGKNSVIMMSAENAYKNKDELYRLWSRRLAEKVSLYTISTPMWTNLASTYRIARKLDAIPQMLTSQAPLDDLIENGTLLFKFIK